MHKLENKNFPDASNNFSQKTSDGHSYNTRTAALGLHQQFLAKTKQYGKLSFKNICIEDWNCFRLMFNKKNPSDLSAKKIKKLFTETFCQYCVK